MAASPLLPGLGAPVAPGPAAMPMQPPPGMPMGMPGAGMPGMMPGMAPAMPQAPLDPVEAYIPEAEWPDLYERKRAEYRDDLEHWSKWREEARKDFAFRDGDQWDERTRQLLEGQKRPASTFNTVGAMIKAVAGYEVANRQEPRFIQRNMGAAGISELTTAGARYFRDQTHAEHHESAAFRDAATCGIGCTEAYIDYDDDEDGRYRKRKVSVLEVLPDSRAVEDNLADGKRVHRARRMRVSEALDMFSDIEGIERKDLHAAWADDDSLGKPIRNERPDAYADPGDDEYPDTREIVVVETQWWEFVPTVRFLDPFTGRMRRLSRERFSLLSERMLAMGEQAPRGAPGKKKVWFRAFLGAKVLSVTGTPVQGHFTYQFITGERDEVKGTYYGLVRNLRDPQQFLNKLISNMTHILNTNAKGGIVAERGAFEDDRRAAEDWAKPDSIVFANAGTLSNPMGPKFTPKPQTQVNPAYFQLTDFAMGMGPRVSGLNAEFLGMQTTDQAGVLEYQRRQSTVTILATAFDNLKLYRKQDGDYILRLMQEYLSDGRLVRIVGEEGQRFLPLNRDVTVGDYEVIVDDAPTSPNMKEQQWQVIQTMMPLLQPIVGNNPEAIAELMKDAPLAESRKAKLYEILMRKPDPQQVAQQQAMQAEQMQAQRARAYAEINKTDATAEKARADALKTIAETVTPFLDVPPVLEGPFPVMPAAPMMPPQPPMGPGMPQNAPQAAMMPQGAPQPMPMAPAPQQPAMPRSPVPPVQIPPGLRVLGA